MSVSIIANKITSLDAIDTKAITTILDKNTTKPLPKEIKIDITNLDDNKKDKLRGLLRFFMGDRMNLAVTIINDNKEYPTSGIFANEQVINEIKEIVGSDNVK